MYFSNSQARRLLPMPPWPTTAASRARTLALRGVEQLLEQPQLLVAPGERRLERAGSAGSAAQRDDGRRSPRRNGRCLSLEQLLTGLLERDGAARRAIRALADQHRSRWRDGLESAGGVDEVAGDHPLAAGADRHGRLARQHAGANLDLEAVAQRWHAGDDVERRAHRPLSVVLVRRRRAPDGHDRVADELLDRAAVALDDGPSQLEVARQELARVLGILVLRERGEPHEIREQDRHQAPFGGARRRRDGPGTGAAGWRGRSAQRGSAFAAELGLVGVLGAAVRAARRQARAALHAELAAASFAVLQLAHRSRPNQRISGLGASQRDMLNVYS